MEPEKFDKKKFNNINLSWSFVVPANVHRLIHRHKNETVEEMVERLDEVDAVIDVMTSYPTAEKMLDKLYGKA